MLQLVLPSPSLLPSQLGTENVRTVCSRFLKLIPLIFRSCLTTHCWKLRPGLSSIVTVTPHPLPSSPQREPPLIYLESFIVLRLAKQQLTKYPIVEVAVQLQWQSNWQMRWPYIRSEVVHHHLSLFVTLFCKPQ